MNWLGRLIQPEVSKEDIVLDIGCGLMQSTFGLECKDHVGFEVYEPYIKILKSAGIDVNNADITNIEFQSKADVALILDVIEHMQKSDGLKLIDQLKTVVNKIIIYTPKEFVSNDGDLTNPYQEHKCLWTEEEFKLMGFETQLTKIDGNILAIWRKE